MKYQNVKFILLVFITIISLSSLYGLTDKEQKALDKKIKKERATAYKARRNERKRIKTIIGEKLKAYKEIKKKHANQLLQKTKKLREECEYKKKQLDIDNEKEINKLNLEFKGVINSYKLMSAIGNKKKDSKKFEEVSKKVKDYTDRIAQKNLKTKEKKIKVVTQYYSDLSELKIKSIEDNINAWESFNFDQLHQPIKVEPVGDSLSEREEKEIKKHKQKYLDWKTGVKKSRNESMIEQKTHAINFKYKKQELALDFEQEKELVEMKLYADQGLFLMGLSVPPKSAAEKKEDEKGGNIYLQKLNELHAKRREIELKYKSKKLELNKQKADEIGKFKSASSK